MTDEPPVQVLAVVDDQHVGPFPTVNHARSFLTDRRLEGSAVQLPEGVIEPATILPVDTDRWPLYETFEDRQTALAEAAQADANRIAQEATNEDA